MQNLKPTVQWLRKTGRLLQASTVVLLIALVFVTATSANGFSAHLKLESESLSVQDQQLPVLELGKTLEGELAGDGSHSYRIKLEARQYVHVVVQQKACDVALAIYLPTGAMAFRLDSPNGSQGAETLCFIAEMTGDYRLAVNSATHIAPLGRYEVKIDQLRVANEQDKVQVAAQTAFFQGELLRGAETEKSLHNAIKKYEESLRLYQSIGDQAKAFDALHHIGVCYLILSRPQEALPFQKQALTIAKSLNDRSREAEICASLGATQNDLGEQRKALDFFIRGSQLRASVGDRFWQSNAFKHTGSIYFNLGDVKNALSYFRQALHLSKSIGDRKGEVSLLGQLGMVYAFLGDLQNALGFYEQAVEISNATGDQKRWLSSLTSIGNIYSKLNNSQKANEVFHQLLALIPKIGNHKITANTLAALGLMKSNIGESASAIEFFQKALVMKNQAGDRVAEIDLLQNLGLEYRKINQPINALDAFRRALSVNQQIGNRSISSTLFNHLGETYERIGDLPNAFDCFHRSLQDARASENGRWLGKILYNLARLHYQRAQFAESRSYIEAALETVKELRDDLHSEDLRTSYLASVHQFYAFYIQLLSEMHKKDPSQRLDALAFQVSDQFHAHTLVALLNQSDSEIRPGDGANLLERKKRLRELINAKGDVRIRLLSSQASEAQKALLAQVDKEVRDLKAQYEEALAEIRAKNPHYAALTQPQPLSLAEIQKDVLDDDTLLLEYSLGDERSYLWAVSKDSLASFALPPRQQIEAAAQQFNEAILAYQDLPDDTAEKRLTRKAAANQKLSIAAAALSQMLLVPAANLLGNKRLLIVPDGILHYLPFAALTDPSDTVSSRQKAVGSMEKVSSKQKAVGSKQKATSSNHAKGNEQPTRGNRQPTMGDGQPLLVNHEIVTLPSASVLAVIRQETKSRAIAPKTIAIFADPVFDNKDERVIRAINSATKSKPAKQTKTKTRIQNRSATSALQNRDAAGASPSRSATKAGAINRTTVEENSDAQDSQRGRALRSALTDRGSFARLHFSREEAEAIYQAVKDKSALKHLDFEANLQAALNERLKEYKIIHFSTHGILNSQQPELSGIVLSLIDEQGKRRDGFLGLAEIFNLKLPVELVTLSACETALGKEIRGEGIVGLTRGFMYAGAKRVVASLWKVQDAATARLMTGFYTDVLNGKRPAEALRQAQLKLWQSKTKGSPYYWAGFVLQGDWR